MKISVITATWNCAENGPENMAVVTAGHVADLPRPLMHARGTRNGSWRRCGYAVPMTRHRLPERPEVLMFWSFGRFAHQRRLAKELRKRPLDRATVEELGTVLDTQYKELPWGLLWSAMDLLKKAQSEVREDDPLHPVLARILRSSTWEIQNRSRGPF